MSMFMRAWLWVLAMAGTLVALGGCGAGPGATPVSPSPLGDSRQIVRVLADHWDATSASLQCFERSGLGGAWQPVGPCVPVSIGRTGLAWGLGRHGGVAGQGPVKREGDGKAPAGVFELGKAFGYAPPGEVQGLRMAYIHLTDDVFGVDDVKSRYYNRIVRLGDVPGKDWDSAETMRRPDGLYEWGVVVGHNVRPVAGAGSCIFLHLWKGPGKPTAGCTAMSKGDMVRILGWLDAGCKPLLVQLPAGVYCELADAWALPVLR